MGSFEQVKTKTFDKEKFIFPDDVRGTRLNIFFLAMGADRDSGEAQQLALIDWHVALAERGVLIDPDQRRRLLDEQAAELATEVGCRVHPDDELVGIEIIPRLQEYLQSQHHASIITSGSAHQAATGHSTTGSRAQAPHTPGTWATGTTGTG